MISFFHRFIYSIMVSWALLVISLVPGTVSAAFQHVQEGMKTPELSGRDLISGEKVSSKDFVDEGAEVVVVVFWATWSPRSIEFLRDLKGLVEEYSGRPFRALAINVDGLSVSVQTRKTIDSTLAELDLPFPVLLDPKLEFYKSYGVIAVPSSAVLDHRHILRSGPSGYSFVVRDAIADSISVLLDPKVGGSPDVVSSGYRPKRRSISYYNMAVQLFNKGMLERALSNVERAVAADTLFSSPQSLRGQILLDLGETEKAEITFGLAVELDHTSVVALAGWGDVLLKLGRLDEAGATLDKALALDPTYTPALLTLAKCRLQEGDQAATGAYLMAAFELNPRDPKVLYNLGSYYRICRRNPEAVDVYRKALEQLGH